MDLVVTQERRACYLSLGDRRWRCAIGRGGIKRFKREGDGATPAGRWPLRGVFFRRDRIPTPETELLMEALEPDDGWCDDPADAHYNCLVKRPYGSRNERLWRMDNLYDILVVIGYNDSPARPGKGSAIFMHLAKSNYAPTEGCVSLTYPDLLEVLSLVEPETRLLIKEP